nr:NADH dehydrogenase subunit 3 [Eurycercus lamellatus]
MFYLLIYIPLIFLIVLVVMMLGMLLSKKTCGSREKMSPFECGFDSNVSARLPFSLRFFLITILFLIFDVEVVLLLPSVKSFILSSTNSWWVAFSTFLIVLLLGLFHEWNEGSLAWSI